MDVGCVLIVVVGIQRGGGVECRGWAGGSNCSGHEGGRGYGSVVPYRPASRLFCGLLTRQPTPKSLPRQELRRIRERLAAGQVAHPPTHSPPTPTTPAADPTLTTSTAPIAPTPLKDFT